ncbi:MAG TPA: hypothetical protein PK208_00700 [Fibrobacteria bacterium]|nr:hypothetical protein [Fibrobacteria bacterium]
MNRFANLLAWGLVGGALAVGCGTDTPNSGGGGVETGDLTVLLSSTDGSTLVAARVWVLDDPGDSGAAVALDSAVVGTTGAVAFPALDRETGVEAWSGDTLAALERSRARLPGDTVRLKLVRPVPVKLPCAPYAGMTIHQPGSARRWQVPASCVDSFQVPVVPPAKLLRAVPASPPYRPEIILLEAAKSPE